MWKCSAASIGDQQNAAVLEDGRSDRRSDVPRRYPRKGRHPWKRVIGEVVTNNAKVFENIPLKIPYQGELVLRGEAIIRYSDFEKINEEIEDVDAKYKNPRNLCSGSVRQLNNEITAKRHVHFMAFALVSAPEQDFENSRIRQMEWLKEQGFEVVEYKVVTKDNLDEAMQYFSTKIETNDFPSDGLVALYDDIAYGESLGTTAKFPRNAFAFKWADEQKETTLLEIEWSPSRTVSSIRLRF